MMAYYATAGDHLVKHAIIGISDVDQKDTTGVFGFENAVISILKERQKEQHTLHEFRKAVRPTTRAATAFMTSPAELSL